MYKMRFVLFWLMLKLTKMCRLTGPHLHGCPLSAITSLLPGPSSVSEGWRQAGGGRDVPAAALVTAVVMVPPLLTPAAPAPASLLLRRLQRLEVAEQNLLVVSVRLEQDDGGGGAEPGDGGLVVLLVLTHNSCVGCWSGRDIALFENKFQLHTCGIAVLRRGGIKPLANTCNNSRTRIEK